MKIAILSMQKIINYGSVLQAYSLQQIVEDITGTKVDFIDIEENDLKEIANFKDIVKSYLKMERISQNETK